MTLILIMILIINDIIIKIKVIIFKGTDNCLKVYF